MRPRFAISIFAAGLAVLLGATFPVEAQEETAAPDPGEPQVAVSNQSGRFNGRTVRYTTTAGETYLKDGDGAPTASIFSIAYTEQGIDDPASRPVTFLWNGGPGSSSVWLHMGAFGPKRVVVPSDARDDGAPPFRVIDNELTILDVTDLVFIDPVGTGFSRPLGKHEGKEFWGLTEDARSVAQFIRQWLSDNDRWASPKYIGGESYGTTRSATVINQLESGFDDVSVNGIILISTILDFATTGFRTGSDLPHIAFLPTMAATARYHGKVPDGPDDLETFLADAREFARTDYAVALLKGDELAGEERDRIRARLAYFTGLSEDYLEQTNLRVTAGRFYKELLRDEGLTVGRLDGRYRGRDLDNAGETPETDPSFYGIDGAYTAAINDYLRRELGVEIDRHYTVIGGLFGNWNWQIDGMNPRIGMSVAPYIGTAMRQNADLRVFNAAGYYDFATPFFGAEMSLNRNGLVADRVTYAYYEAGHMMYVHEPSLTRLLADIRAFIEAGP